MTEEWLNEIENFGTRRERLLEEIEGVLSRFGGDILDNGPNGSMRYLSDHLKDLVVRWAEGAMQHEREATIRWAMKGSSDAVEVGELWAEGYNSALADCFDDTMRRSRSSATGEK